MKTVEMEKVTKSLLNWKGVIIQFMGKINLQCRI